MKKIFTLVYLFLLLFCFSNCSRNDTVIKGNNSNVLYASKSTLAVPNLVVEYVNSADLWIFKRQSTSSAKLGELHLGDSIVVIARQSNGWAKVQWGDKIAYANQAYFSSNPPVPSKISSPSVPSRHTYITGPQGGCYYVDSNGNKVYVDRSLCGQSQSTSPLVSPSHAPQSTSPTYHTGPRGGTYHYTQSGKKSYYKPKK